MEDGRPFCPQCRAPQIHVQIAAAAESVTAVPEATDHLASTRLPEARDFGSTQAVESSLYDRAVVVRSALKAGVLGVFIGIIPFIGIVLTGSCGVYFYRREKGFAPPVRIAARVGAAAGVVSFAISSVLIVIRIVVLHAQQEYDDTVTKMARLAGYNPADPDIQAGIHSLFTPGGLVLTIFFGMIFSLALAALGGAVAALLLRPRGRS